MYAKSRSLQLLTSASAIPNNLAVSSLKKNKMAESVAVIHQVYGNAFEYNNHFLGAKYKFEHTNMYICNVSTRLFIIFTYPKKVKINVYLLTTVFHTLLPLKMILMRLAYLDIDLEKHR